TTGGTPQGTILMLDPPEVIRKKVRSAVTDSGSDVRRGPDKAGVTNLIDVMTVATGEAQEAIEARYDGSGYGQFKAGVGEPGGEAGGGGGGGGPAAGGSREAGGRPAQPAAPAGRGRREGGGGGAPDPREVVPPQGLRSPGETPPAAEPFLRPPLPHRHAGRTLA